MTIPQILARTERFRPYTEKLNESSRPRPSAGMRPGSTAAASSSRNARHAAAHPSAVRGNCRIGGPPTVGSQIAYRSEVRPRIERWPRWSIIVAPFSGRTSGCGGLERVELGPGGRPRRRVEGERPDRGPAGAEVPDRVGVGGSPEAVPAARVVDGDHGDERPRAGRFQIAYSSSVLPRP